MNPDDRQAVIKHLYHEYSDDIYKFILFLLKDVQLSEDLTQDTFINAYRNLEQFKHHSAYKTWLLRIAKNVTIDYLRKKRPISYNFDLIFNRLTDQSALPEEIAIANDDEKTFYIALNKIKFKYRLIIYLRKIKELSIAETAGILNVPEERVKTDLFRGLKLLKKQLEKEGYQHGYEQSKVY